MEYQYIDSGIEWIGRIPSKWKACRFKDFVFMRTAPSTSAIKIGLENIESESGHFIATQGKFDGNGIQFSIGDVVYGKLRPYLRKVWLATFDGNAVGDFFVFRNKENAYPQFVKWLFLSDGFSETVNSSVYGAKMPRVSSEFILTLPFFLPSLSEQHLIADYLDNKCGEIDGLIALQEQMIAQLMDYKQSVITEAITKGLNPDVQFVPSGIDWIGDVPKGWEVCRFKSYISLVKEKVKEANLPKINLENIESYSGKFIETDSKYEGEGCLFRPGDVLFGKLRPYLAKVFVPDYKGQAVGDFYVFRPSSKIETNFLKYVILSDTFLSNVNSSTYGTKMPRANWDFISNVYIAVPSKNEQLTISELLDVKCGEIDRLIATKRQKIETLKKYKKSIINEAVTGKIIIV